MGSKIAGGWSLQSPGTSRLLPGGGRDFRHSTRWVKPGITGDGQVNAVLVEATVSQVTPSSQSSAILHHFVKTTFVYRNPMRSRLFVTLSSLLK